MSGSAEPWSEPAPPIPKRNRSVLKVVVIVAVMIVGVIAFVFANAYVNNVNYSVNRPDVTSATIGATCTNCYNASQYPDQQVISREQFIGNLWTEEAKQSRVESFVNGNNTGAWTVARTNTHQVWTVGWTFDLVVYQFNNGTELGPPGGTLRVRVTLNTGQVVYDHSNDPCSPNQIFSEKASCWSVWDSWIT